jgi:hypothetical protein
MGIDCRTIKGLCLQPEEHAGHFFPIRTYTLFLILHDFQEPTLNVAEGKILFLFKVGQRPIARFWRNLTRSANADRIGFESVDGKNLL